MPPLHLPLGWIVYACWLLAWSVVTFVVYGWDKRAARAAKRRVPERTLHTLALIGGFVGGWLGRHGFRHKTRKRSFGVVLIAATLGHAAVTTWLLLG